MKSWCDRVSATTRTTWRYARINQKSFRVDHITTLREAITQQCDETTPESHSNR